MRHVGGAAARRARSRRVAILSWSLSLAAEDERGEVEEVFEFVEGDCELAIECDGDQPPASFDIAALLASVKSDPIVDSDRGCAGTGSGSPSSPPPSLPEPTARR